jgi:hypothetical protein
VTEDQDTNLGPLLAQAGEIDGAVAATAPEAIQAAQEEAAALSLADENTQGVTMIMELALPLICPMFPSLEQVYTAEARQAIAISMGPLLAKYGVNLKEAGGKYKEELVAAMVCGPIAVATYRGIKTDIATRAGAPKAVEHVPAGAALAAPAPSALKPGDYGYVEAQQAPIPA